MGGWVGVGCGWGKLLCDASSKAGGLAWLTGLARNFDEGRTRVGAGAVAEAGFMTGLERNSEVVLAAAYAPLFVNANSRPWPTNLIVFDNHR